MGTPRILEESHHRQAQNQTQPKLGYGQAIVEEDEVHVQISSLNSLNFEGSQFRAPSDAENMHPNTAGGIGMRKQGCVRKICRMPRVAV